MAQRPPGYASKTHSLKKPTIKKLFTPHCVLKFGNAFLALFFNTFHRDSLKCETNRAGTPRW